MTDAPRKAALQDLLADVAAGRLPDNLVSAEPFCGTDFKVGQDVACAYIGSLDAAKALHEAVLPDGEGWEVYRTGKYPGMIPGSSIFAYAARVGYGRTFSGHADLPARAWLIAILKALIAQDAEQP